MANLELSDNNMPLDKELASKFKEILVQNGITTPVSQVLLKDSGLRGENFLSVTNYVTVKFTDESERPPLYLFTKRKFGDEQNDAMADDYKVFEKEAQFFTEFIPLAKKCCESKGLSNLMDIYPKCYYGDKDMIVLENLVLHYGYFLIDKIQRQDFEATSLSLKHLAKHHAISHAVIQEMGGPQPFLEKFPEFLNHHLGRSLTATWFPGLIQTGVNANIELLEKSTHPDSQATVKKLKERFTGEKSLEVVQNLVRNRDENSFCTLNHGDYWNNNMMFTKDKETGSLVSQILVDFQAIQYGSPCIDLGYYLFLSVQDKIRRERIGDLLKLYYESLLRFTEQLGHPISWTFEELKKDFCKYFEVGFHFGNVAVSQAGMQVMKEIDMIEVGGMGGWAAKIDELSRQWLDKHPEKREIFARNVIEEIKEYGRLKNGII